MKHLCITFAIVFLSIAAIATADDGKVCSAATLAGAWGYTEIGWVVPPTGAVPAAAAGRYDFDSKGSFEGKQNSSAGGVVAEDTKQGTYTVKSDCTGQLSLRVYDGQGKLLRTSVWAIVLADNGREMRGIMISLILPNGTSLPPVMTLTGRRLFSGHGKD